MLNSAEQAQLSWVWISFFFFFLMTKWNFMLSWVVHEKNFKTMGPEFAHFKHVWRHLFSWPTPNNMWITVWHALTKEVFALSLVKPWILGFPSALIRQHVCTGRSDSSHDIRYIFSHDVTHVLFVCGTIIRKISKFCLHSHITYWKS